MNPMSNTYEREGAALRDQGAPERVPLTLMEYLSGSVNIDIPEDVIARICLDRDADMLSAATDVDKSVRDLCKADLLIWMVMGVTRRGAVADSDNGWSHSDGGFTITDSDKKLFLRMANAIYESNGEETVGGARFRIKSHGIQPSNIGMNGMPLPHIVR